MNVLVLGSGGREHAISWKIAKSPLLKQLFIAPGNAGTAEIGTNVDLQLPDFESIKNFIDEEKINILIVGPEAPLVNGLVDYLRDNLDYDQPIMVGPSKAGARLEGSKEFAKSFMAKHGIPTAKYGCFTHKTRMEGKEFLSSMNPPYVLKADGLAAGKGVLILDDLTLAKKELETMLNGKFGEASNKVVVEEFLSGIEFSVFVLTNGEDYKILPIAKDYKRIGEGDTGLNTGGMGAISPVPFVTAELMDKVTEQIIKPTIEGLRKDKIDYQGFIFFGLINVDGNPFVIEYNCRLGDPETEAILPRIDSDFLEVLSKMPNSELPSITISDEHAATVMLVSGGYPETYEKGKIISNLGDSDDKTLLFHSGTKREKENILTNGGRVLAITSLAKNPQDALEKSLKTADKISFQGKYFRTDIGFDL